MLRIAALSMFTIFLGACSGPKDTPIPKDLSKIESISSSVKKLDAEERELFAGYLVRHTVGSMFGGLLGGKATATIPDGMTLGKAIDEQRQFKAESALEVSKQAALKEKLRAEREVAMKTMREAVTVTVNCRRVLAKLLVAMKTMREAVTVTLVSKALKDEVGRSGMQLDELLEVTFGYKNNSAKDIAGVKGYVSVRDLFDDEISGFAVSNDKTIRAGETSVWKGSRSVKYSFANNKDRKLGELADDKFKVVWEPKVVVFADGSKLTAPD